MVCSLTQIQLNSLHNFHESVEGRARFKMYSFDEIVDKITSTEPIKTNCGYIWVIKRAKGIELNVETSEWKFHGLGFH